MTKGRVWREVLGAVLIGLCVDLAAAAARAAPVTLRIATSDIYGVANTFAAAGDDKAGDVTFEIVRFTGGVTDILAALRAGQVDVAEVGAAGPVVAQAAGGAFKVVAVTQPWPKGEAIIVAKDSPIRTVEDLRGKKVAYSRATNAQWLVVGALRSKGLTLKDVQSTFLPAGTNLLNALQAGIIDATAYIDYPLANYEAQGVRRIVDHGDTGFPIALQFLATDEAIRTKREALAAYVRQLDKHLGWAHAHPEDRAKIVAGLLRLDPAIVLVAEKRRPVGLRPIDDVIVRGNQDIADAFAAEGVIPAKLDVATTFTRDFNKEIVP